MVTDEMLEALTEEMVHLSRVAITRSQHFRLSDLRGVVGQPVPNEADIVRLFNPHHDELGRFASNVGGGGLVGRAIEAQKRAYKAARDIAPYAVKEGLKKGAVQGLIVMTLKRVAKILLRGGGFSWASLIEIGASAAYGTASGAARGAAVYGVGHATMAAYKEWIKAFSGEEADESVLADFRKMLVMLIGDKDDGEISIPADIEHADILIKLGFKKSGAAYTMPTVRAMAMVLKINEMIGG